MKQTKARNHGKRLSGICAVITILLVMLMTLPLTACEKPGRPSSTYADFIGIWACYQSREGKEYTEHDLEHGMNMFLIILKDNVAYEVITKDGAEPRGMEFWWDKTREDKQMGTESGVIFVNDQREHQFIYYDAGEKPHFIDERLVKGNLSIKYSDGYSDYYEKVSNDPYDPLWLPGANQSTASPASSSGIPDGAISWDDAKSHIGERVTVYGPVKDSSYMSSSNNQPTYIDIGAAYPEERRVSMVVWGEDRGNFPDKPESMYLGKTICVTGELYSHDGVTYVKVATPDQIRVLD